MPKVHLILLVGDDLGTDVKGLLGQSRRCGCGQNDWRDDGWCRHRCQERGNGDSEGRRCQA